MRRVRLAADLLQMCEHAKGKNNKAVIASNIMYIVGQVWGRHSAAPRMAHRTHAALHSCGCVCAQYPRFLRAHWRFLKTVVHKLFEFMHEKHPGVQVGCALGGRVVVHTGFVCACVQDMACDTFLKIAQKCRKMFAAPQVRWGLHCMCVCTPVSGVDGAAAAAVTGGGADDVH